MLESLNSFYFRRVIGRIAEEMLTQGSLLPFWSRVFFGATCLALIPILAETDPFEITGFDSDTRSALEYATVGYIGVRAAWATVLFSQAIWSWTGIPIKTIEPKEA